MHIFIKISFIFTLIFLLGCKEKEYVKDFKVEGIAVGDSLLTYFSEEDILKNQRTKDILGNPDDGTSLHADSVFENPASVAAVCHFPFLPHFRQVNFWVKALQGTGVTASLTRVESSVSTSRSVSN